MASKGAGQSLLKVLSMDNGRLTRLLWHDSAEARAGTPFCPEDQVIVGYFEGALGEAERECLKNHLVECRFCQARLGNLARSTELTEESPVPARLLADAKQIGQQTTPVKRNRQAPAWAAAAVVVLAVALVFSSQWQGAPGGDASQSVTPPAEEGTRQLRSLARIPSEIQLVSPSPGDTLSRGTQVHWSEIPDTDYYDLFVLSTAGDMVWTERLQVASWSPQDAEGLIPGNRYYLRVEATLRDGSSVSSRHLDIRYADR